MRPSLGVVVIARNGGDRLDRSLRSVLASGFPVVYADSASDDGSPERARNLGAVVVELDDSAPHTAARGRNAGFQRLREMVPGVELVQFVDGDTTIDEGWIRRAMIAMREDASLGVVCGHLRERNRSASVFSRMFDLEWRGPVGDIRSSGGNMMVRADHFDQIGGFDAGLRGGEEANLCARIRLAGGRVTRIDATMGEHDSGISTLAQWWRRTVRVGYGYAEAAAGRGPGADRGKAKQVISSVVWAGFLPAVMTVAAAGAWWRHSLLWVATAVAALYVLMAVRIFVSGRRRGYDTGDSWIYSTLCLLAKWPQLQGAVRYWMSR